MNLPEFSVKNSLLINVISVFVLVLGFFSMYQMKREAFPSVDYDIVTVTTLWPGAPTEDVEKFVTIPLEKEIKSVSGIEEITSKSDEGLSSIGVTIDPGIRDKKKVVRDVERAVDRVQTLPDEVDDPQVFELATKEFPVIEISLSGPVTEEQRREMAENLEELILDIPGVAQVNRFGWRDREFWVEVDPQKMAVFHVSLQEVMQALASRNITVPAGQLKTENNEFNIRTTGEFSTPNEIAEVIIRANDSGNWLKVKDVASVVETFEDPVTLAHVNAQRATAMVVVKAEQADAIKVVDQVKEALDEFRNQLPEGMEITVSNDFSYYVKRRLGVLQNNGILGFILVVFILFLFMDPIPAFMTALGIPFVMFLAFFVMLAMGISINLVSMLGIILVLGMLVDDGIVVSENVYRYIEEGMEPRQAVVKGTREVMGPVVGTILTTFAAFGPLLFMTDIIGKFIREIPIVVILMLSASLIEAFIVLPSHLADCFEVFKVRQKYKPKERKWFTGLKNVYLKQLNFFLNFKGLFLTGMILLFAFSIWVAATQMKFLLFAGEGIEYFWVRAEAPKGIPIEKMEELMKPVESVVAKLPKNELDAYRTFIGSIETEGGFDPNAKRGSHLAQLTVFLTPMQKRERTPQEISDEIRAGLKDIPGFEKLYIFMPKEGPPTGSPVEVGIKGEDYAVMQKMAGHFIEYLNSREGVSDVATSYDFGKKQLIINVNEEKAKQYYLTIESIAMAVRNAFRGGLATTIKPVKAEEEIDVLVRFRQDARKDMKAFENILIPNAKGNLVKLNSVAQIEEKEGIYLISHLDGKRVLYVTAQVDNKKATSLEVNRELQKQFQGLEREYPGYSVIFSGEFEDQQKSTKNLIASFLFALFLIFIILVAEFKSLFQPLIVMLAIPFGIIGVILSFWAHDIFTGGGRPLNFFAMMGLVGLTGIVVNDSIVLVDFINRMRREGKSRRESILKAGELRLRPILMTTITTVGGLVSVAYGIGGGDPFLKPMALAIVWGLIFSTFLTLIGIPCFYALMDDFVENVLHRHLIKTDKSSVV